VGGDCTGFGCTFGSPDVGGKKAIAAMASF
jgi:hypothetical protein